MTKLKTIGLSRRFLGLVAVNKVSFSMDEGEILGIIGPNGAGKTTFINLISGIIMPGEGKIEYKGQDITYMPAHERARLGIARTYQLIHPLENLSLIENVMVGSIFARGHSMREARRRAADLCGELGLKDLDRDTSKLTILEVKKMEIARALANEPEVLFLDEVMAGLNADETKDLIATVQRIARERKLAVGVVEHVMGVIRELTHRVIVLEAGELIAEGPYEEVSKNPRVVEAYLGGAA
ncbi:MAG: ABC transporter ATP-binding protein [Spirochaetia bacterium]|jgi:branched-chain amino acid transport system ATP-binding protein|uniref:Methionine import ATP-binding protein MetN 2 n=1 Tax=bioreactor metagenome TaxID=1076179 RepID=A0A644TVL1_9ZZZZ|nr:ABC transporter ATP-binding protein [Spirochaetia bacterium]MCE1208788.1 ABC transporter ATP-binding protein [Spirochaetia bacterium]MDD3819890.1 ABC transporter ATP-binding protein [Spirochaetales bacterium]HAP54522.1 ABC transporter ATP-binding protein [Spirochaetaceae bacterium]HOI22184.1 ABC transporter ATP-binding protein [Spirochaetales bacterium]